MVGCVVGSCVRARALCYHNNDSNIWGPRRAGDGYIHSRWSCGVPSLVWTFFLSGGYSLSLHSARPVGRAPRTGYSPLSPAPIGSVLRQSGWDIFCARLRAPVTGSLHAAIRPFRFLFRSFGISFATIVLIPNSESLSLVPKIDLLRNTRGASSPPRASPRCVFHGCLGCGFAFFLSMRLALVWARALPRLAEESLLRSPIAGRISVCWSRDARERWRAPLKKGVA